VPRLDAKTVGKTEARFDYLNLEKDNDNFGGNEKLKTNKMGKNTYFN
jgi:hypothetical protein